MDSSLSILIIEDDADTCRRFENIIDTSSELHLIASTNSSEAGMNYMKQYIPDVVILDLELQKGTGSGIEFLKNLELNAELAKPYIIITTYNSSPLTHSYAHSHGCDFIMSKFEDDYSEQKVIDFIITMKDVIKKSKSQSLTSHNIAETPAVREKRLHRIITAHLNSVGISPKVLGYKYLADSISLLLDKSDVNFCLEVGKKYGKTAASVERAMQNAINNAWRTTNTDDLEKYYTARIDINRGAPTIMEFVYYYADRVKSENTL